MKLEQQQLAEHDETKGELFFSTYSLRDNLVHTCTKHRPVTSD